MAVAIAGFAAIVVGVYQGLVHVAPGYEGTVVTDWGGSGSHEERLLVQWGLVLFYALRAVARYARSPGLSTAVTRHGADPIRPVLGGEPILLLAGGGLLVVAGVAGRSIHAGRASDAAPSA